MKLDEKVVVQGQGSSVSETIEKPKRGILFPITISRVELEVWKKCAEKNNLALAEYIRVLMREGVAGIKEIEVNKLKETYERRVKELEALNFQLRQEMETLKNHLILRLSKFLETENIQKTEKTIVKIRKFKELLGDKEIEVVYSPNGIREKKSYENSLIEEEMNSMNSEDRDKVKHIVMRDKDSLVVAIKKVKGRCSEEFEEYFKKDLKGVRWHKID